MPTETGGMMQLHFHMTNLSSEFSWVREDIIQVESVEVLRMDFDGRLDDAEWHLVAVPLGSSTRTCREHFYQGLPLPAGGTVETAMLFHVEPDESTAPMLIRVSYRVPFLGAPDGGPDADLAACRHLEITAPQSLNVLIPDQGRVESAE